MINEKYYVCIHKLTAFNFNKIMFMNKIKLYPTPVPGDLKIRKSTCQIEVHFSIQLLNVSK